MAHLTTHAGHFSLGQMAKVRLYETSVIAPTLALLGYGLATQGQSLLRGRLDDILFWTLVIGIVELLPVPAWRSLQVSVALPLFMGVAFTLPPFVAGWVAFLGSSDPREFKREVRPLRALFNRSQAALAVYAASYVFHALSGSPVEWSGLAPAMLAVLIDYLVNSSLVSIAISLSYDVSFVSVLRRLRIGNPLEFVVSYVGLGFLGVLLARLYLEVAPWAVAAFVMPLLLARQMFFRTRALEQATQELKEREVILRALSNRMAEERHDERMQIAGYLHDDMAQLLFRMSLHIDILSKQLAAGKTEEANEEIAQIRVAKDRSSKLLRGLIKDLRLSPLGRAGLIDALTSFSLDVEKEWKVRVTPRLREVEMPAPVQLLAYQLVREAVVNAAKHADATQIQITLEPTSDGARIVVHDDGKGFDPEDGSPAGHFGLSLMRERAQVAGGTLKIETAPDRGTSVIAEFPTSWLFELEPPPSSPADEDRGA